LRPRPKIDKSFFASFFSKKEVFFFEKKKQKTFVSLVLGLMLLSASSAWACPVPGQREEVRVTLYFGRDRIGQAPVSDAEWRGFAATALTGDFPDGFTESDGTGQWRDPHTGRIVREASKIVDVVTDGAGLAAKIGMVTGDYERRFHQESVGVVTESVCAEF